MSAPYPYKPPVASVVTHYLKSIQVPAVLSKLTEWETNFIVSIDKQWHDRGTLSQKQHEILERIYADKTN